MAWNLQLAVGPFLQLLLIGFALGLPARVLELLLEITVSPSKRHASKTSLGARFRGVLAGLSLVLGVLVGAVAAGEALHVFD